MENTPNTKTPVSADFTLTIWASKKLLFEKKMKHLNRILAKHGKPPIRFSFPRTNLCRLTRHILHTLHNLFIFPSLPYAVGLLHSITHGTRK